MSTLPRLLAGIAADSPSGEIAGSPVLENWRMRLNLLGCVFLDGMISGDPRFGDGNKVSTSQLGAIDPNFQWARTHNTLYRLGTALADAYPPVLTVATYCETWSDAFDLLWQRSDWPAEMRGRVLALTYDWKGNEGWT